MQISKTVLTNYNKGDVYNIPFGLGHASSNFGYCPQYTISFTGIIND
jgi:oxalate decarboxylase/phosphoglucose isomerase-like protein (cupin superfamily)